MGRVRQPGVSRGRDGGTRPGISDAGHLLSPPNIKIGRPHGITGIHRGILMNSAAQTGLESASEADSTHVGVRFCYSMV